MDETQVDWKFDDVRKLGLQCFGEHIVATFDGEKILEADVPELISGGTGLIFEKGIVGLRSMTVKTL